jgi:RNA polymerase sigma-70 factor (ECF subfamily)
LNNRSATERFEALWEAHYADVFAFALRRLGDRDAAGEVVAETFLVAWRRLEAVPSPARPWLLGVARNTLANYRRGRRRREALVARIISLEDRQTGDPAADPDVANVVEAFNALRRRDREVLSLVVWEELKPREAAEVLGISPARFSARLHRAKSRLRKKLGGAGHNPTEAENEHEATAEVAADLRTETR